MNILGSF